MSEDLTDEPVGPGEPDDSDAPVYGKRAARISDEPEIDVPLATPALPPIVAQAIAASQGESQAQGDDDEHASRLGGWAESRAARHDARDAARRRAEADAAEQERERALEEERVRLETLHAEQSRQHRAEAVAEAERLRAIVEAEEAEAAHQQSVAATLPALPEIVVEAQPEPEPEPEPEHQPEPQPEPQAEPQAEAAGSAEDEDFARRWAEAEQSILKAQEEQRRRAEAAQAALAASQSAAVPEAQPMPTLEQILEEPTGEAPRVASPAPAAPQEAATKDDASKDRRPADPPPPAEKRRRDERSGLASLRSKLASLVWLVAVLAALVLAVGALVVALELEPSNTIVQAVRDAANAIDFGVFREFDGEDAETKSALVNWGLAAVIWLIVGKVLDKLIRP